MIEIGDLEKLITKCLEETTKASREKYSAEIAERTAGLFLDAQIKLSLFLEDIEYKAKISKNEIDRIEAEKYFEYKELNVGKKITENTLSAYVAKDKSVCETKNNSSKLEAELKKWSYIMNVLRDGHVYFRNLNKNKTWAE